MKVLLIAPLPPPVGGIETVTESLVNYFNTQPDNTELLMYNTSHSIRPVTKQSFLIRIFTGIANSLQTYFKVSRIMRTERPDIVHLASSSSLALFKDLLLIRMAGRLKIPLIIHWHFGRIPQLKRINNWEWKILQHAIRKSSLSIVIDHRSYEVLISEGHTNIVQIPNPLSIAAEEKSRGKMGRFNHRPEGRIIFVGHVIKNKGIYDLVEACAQIPLIKELIVIGPYEEIVRQDLVKIARCRDNGNWLVFTGGIALNMVLEYMNNSPILALPSLTEGFPISIIEAMAMGCAVIASDVGEIPQMLAVHTQTPCGICVPPKDIGKLREAIVSLAGNQSKTAVLGKRGINRVLNNYSIDKVYKQYRTVWESSLNPKTYVLLSLIFTDFI